MLISEAHAKSLMRRVLSLSRAEASRVLLHGHQRAHLRFALNSGTTSGAQEDLVLTVESHFGRRVASSTTNQLDPAALEEVVSRSEQLARLAPEDPEYQPPLGPQKYVPSRTYSAKTAHADVGDLASMVKPILKEAIARKLTAAGFVQAGVAFSALATSNGLSVCERSTAASFTLSARTPDGSGSGWAGGYQRDLGRLDGARLGRTALDKALQSQNPATVAPGKYTVILEPSAVCDLVGLMVGAFDARGADEGRSAFSTGGGRNKLGLEILGKQVNITSDPTAASAPGSIYSTDGLPASPRTWVKNGVLNELIYSRYWAAKTGKDPVPHPTNLLMSGGNTSVEEMIRQTRRGILVTRFWYIREVDPRALLLTGLTRDGTFLIENGRITHPIKNLRFNESPVAMLNHIEAMGMPIPVVGSEVEDWPICVPPLLIRDFTFSSISDAV